MRTYPSPFTTCTIIVGIIAIGAAAPLAPFIFIAAWMIQHKHTGKLRGQHAAAQARHAARVERERDAAYRWFAS